MLEFAYTGEVNVAQDLLPTLLHTARSYKIKGLDKVESPLDPPQVTNTNVYREAIFTVGNCKRYYHYKVDLNYPIPCNSKLAEGGWKLRRLARSIGWNPHPKHAHILQVVSIATRQDQQHQEPIIL